jgi:dolichol-phosphate mannosyltransferase
MTTPGNSRLTGPGGVTATESISIIIPAFNEAGNLERVIRDAVRDAEQTGLRDYEIIMVDDGSTDASASVMAGMAAQIPTFRFVAHDQNRGLGAALRTGFAAAKGAIITWIPGDGQFSLAEVLTGLEQLQSKDVVVALRQGRKEITRSFISTCFHGLIRFLFRFEATDMCGIYLIRRTVLEEIRPRSNDIFLNLEIPLSCVRLGKPLGTIVVSIKPRLSGVSKVANIRTMALNLFEMFKYRFGL